jgi:hypothetical protein
MRVLASVFCLLLVSGCGQSRYTKEGKSTMEAEQDYLACVDSVLAEHEGLQKASSAEKQRFSDQCMEEKGYKTKK